MGKPTSITATYRPNADELLQVTLTIGNDYPDAVNEARATVVKAMRELLTDALALTGRDAD